MLYRLGLYITNVKEVKTSPMLYVLRAFFVSLVVVLAPLAHAAPSLNDVPADATGERYEYFVLRGGSQIGFYRFFVDGKKSETDAQAADDTEQVLRIQTQMGINVKLLFITAYQAEYSATSVYRGRDLLKHDSAATFNGADYLVTYNVSQNPDHLVVNQTGKKINNPPMTLHPFYVEGDRDLTFVTEKGKLRNITFTTIGPEEIKLGTKFYNTTYARMEGDLERDLWYDEDGVLIKVAYQKDGATINLIRKGL